jgi:hypothetical protein
MLIYKATDASLLGQRCFIIGTVMPQYQDSDASLLGQWFGNKDQPLPVLAGF